jgi:Ca2+-binding EF-hand superfamily protein
VELAAALENDEKRAENIMRSFGSGDVIDYTEWVVGTSEKLSVVNLEFAFKYFDKDDKGVIG